MIPHGIIVIESLDDPFLGFVSQGRKDQTESVRHHFPLSFVYQFRVILVKFT